VAEREVFVLLEQMAFPECPRWHDGLLWVSDQHDSRILTVTETSQVDIPVPFVAGRPSGLGWGPDGKLLIVSMLDHKLLRWEGTAPDALTEVADLSPYCGGPANDMVVNPATGHAYIGNFGFDLEADAPPTPTDVVCVAPDGEVWTVIEGACFPNGAVITPDGGTLILAETYGQRLSAYDILPDGGLANPRTWADLQPYVPDGICLDAEGAVWFADPLTKGVGRVVEGTGVVEFVATEQGAYAVALGGVDGCNLYICTADSFKSTETVVARQGRVRMLRADVPGADWR
jgi:sugar lactone lactonase YvrE